MLGGLLQLWLAYSTVTDKLNMAVHIEKTLVRTRASCDNLRQKSARQRKLFMTQY